MRGADILSPQLEENFRRDNDVVLRLKSHVVAGALEQLFVSLAARSWKPTMFQSSALKSTEPTNWDCGSCLLWLWRWTQSRFSPWPVQGRQDRPLNQGKFCGRTNSPKLLRVSTNSGVQECFRRALAPGDVRKQARFPTWATIRPYGKIEATAQSRCWRILSRTCASFLTVAAA